MKEIVPAEQAVTNREHLRWGFRRVWRVLVREGPRFNRKRAQRLWREEGLRLPQKAPGASVWE